MYMDNILHEAFVNMFQENPDLKEKFIASKENAANGRRRKYICNLILSYLSGGRSTTLSLYQGHIRDPYPNISSLFSFLVTDVVLTLPSKKFTIVLNNFKHYVLP